ncbi:ribonuclease III [methane-oxidizing endosymbiont of Gigantopelta aegis]|uniref:ribonuclease III n=1 Tax=methane-oxidizing endosymbiont of Gigantopelta aegis TaxID=2794938 RepID=UPI0018DCCA1F|nr:ribonuclease III [methane-oxidizing endosymbiont of Gigantopelta aegis]
MIRKPEQLAKKLGLQFKRPELFKMALTHRSMGAKNNERLEFLGDSVLGFVIAQALFEKFPASEEGVLSRLRASLVNQASLAELARQHNIGDYLILGAGELKSGGFRRDSILSDAMEAIMGAILLDQGVAACQQFILGLFKEKLAALDVGNWNKDPKTRLQEMMQARQKSLPVYELVNQAGAAHQQTFTVKCVVPVHHETTEASGASRKKAEQAAAEKMLQKLEGNVS